MQLSLKTGLALAILSGFALANPGHAQILYQT